MSSRHGAGAGVGSAARIAPSTQGLDERDVLEPAQAADRAIDPARGRTPVAVAERTRNALAAGGPRAWAPPYATRSSAPSATGSTVNLTQRAWYQVDDSSIVLPLNDDGDHSAVRLLRPGAVTVAGTAFGGDPIDLVLGTRTDTAILTVTEWKRQPPSRP